MLTDAEQHMLAGWNDTADRCVHRAFEAQAVRTPEAVAVTFEESSLTYREIDERANQVAHDLIERGVVSETVVGLCVERGLELMVGVLGILKAGGAYVPLAASYPDSRLAHMVEDSGVEIVITQAHLESRVSPAVRERIRLDADWAGIETQPRVRPRVEIEPDGLAYVIYTSGSTGLPKGVMVTHAALCNQVFAMCDELDVVADDRLLLKTPVSFDVSVLEMFLPLVAGGTLVVASPGGHRDPEYLAQTISRFGITVIHFVPSMLRVFLSVADLASFESLTRVMCGGEALASELVNEVRAKSDIRLFNCYGPTEATVGVTVWRCRPREDGTVVPLGRPTANVRVYVLDPFMNPVPIGAKGEIYIGGVQVARGYVGRPDLTAERFVPDSFSDVAGSRLYRTGDLGCHRADGTIEFLGRIDNQVKVHGFRIELGEIESVLERHAEIREAVVVVVREDRPDQARLIAYLVPTVELPSTAALRDHAGEWLPEYMVPSQFMSLASMPLTPSGKVDRGALQALDPGRPDSERAYVAPQSPIEHLLCDVFAEVLGFEPIGIDDNFFELGGNSIVAARVANELQGHLGEIVHVAALFDAPTVAELGRYLHEHYPHALERVDGGTDVGELSTDHETVRLVAADFAHLRAMLPPVRPVPSPGPRNPSAVFVLAPPRSGSTLLRILLGGHSRLFSPPELELLLHGSLRERRAACSGRYGFMLEGTIRAIMEIEGIDAELATRQMMAYEQEGLTTQQFYARLQSLVAPRVLVDKTTTYCYDVEVLQRAEAWFDAPRYIHLVRHPCGMIHSFRQARLDRIVGFEHPFSPRALAELLWCDAHENAIRFLDEIPAERQLRVHFEGLVREPGRVLEQICAFLGIELESRMLDPYGDQSGRMVDGLHEVSRPIGDFKFEHHGRVDPAIADRWRGHVAPRSLGDAAQCLASSFGYEDDEACTVDRIARAPRVTTQDLEDPGDVAIDSLLDDLLGS